MAEAPRPQPKQPAHPRTVRLDATREPMPKTIGIGQKSRIHEDFYHSVLVWPWWQFFLFVALTFLGVNMVFAALFSLDPSAIVSARPGSFEDAFFFSVQTFATIGYGVMSPGSRFGHIIVAFEALTGIMSGALITGLTYAKFARPTARVLFSDKAVVSNRNGIPHLMFRMANWRRNMVVEAQLRVILLIQETTAEGEVMRRPLELSLVRDRTALFSLSWTATHVIDAASPFFGEGALDRLRAQKTEILLALSGLDETMGQTIHARHRYRLDDIVWNARFMDVLTITEDGTRIIDYSKFHDVIEQATDGVG